MSSKMIKELRRFFKEATGENIRLWCESLSAIARYDSPECSEILAEEGFSEIEKQASEARKALVSVELENPSLGSETLGQRVAALVEEKQNEVFDTFQTAASSEEEEMKVMVLKSLNEADSVFDLIHNNIQTGAIPMLFAVFSRKNDGYGLGTLGA